MAGIFFILIKGLAVHWWIHLETAKIIIEKYKKEIVNAKQLYFEKKKQGYKQ